MSVLRCSGFARGAFLALSVLAGGGLGVAGAAAQSVDTIVVFDGSNSMWGQIDGRAKIEIARETLSSVLSEASNEMQIGLIAYGHRQRGVCSDIETLVPVAPASRSVPAIIDAASRITPRGKTPLTDAVRKAAEELRYTENAATVVLVTDGIETCDADPCALGSELEKFGINFTAHVVGFGLSAEEGRQVQCLAENTGRPLSFGRKCGGTAGRAQADGYRRGGAERGGFRARRACRARRAQCHLHLSRHAGRPPDRNPAAVRRG